jgi:hypothetical protein
MVGAMKRQTAHTRGIQPSANFSEGVSALVRLLARQAAKELLAGAQDQHEDQPHEAHQSRE